jgi:hypothetical protein
MTVWIAPADADTLGATDNAIQSKANRRFTRLRILGITEAGDLER